jgi:hypothetical protein
VDVTPLASRDTQLAARLRRVVVLQAAQSVPANMIAAAGHECVYETPAFGLTGEMRCVCCRNSIHQTGFAPNYTVSYGPTHGFADPGYKPVRNRKQRREDAALSRRKRKPGRRRH